MGGRKVCEGCATWHAKTSLKVQAALENPIHKRTGKDEHEWFHGSKHEFHEFGDPEHDSPLSFAEDHEDNTHWNTLLGNHFTSDHQVAEDFAQGNHNSANNSSSSQSGRVIHTKLHLKNPKVYASEHDMDQEVHEFEHKRGNTIDSHFPPPSEAEAKDWDQFDWEDHHAEMGRAQHYANDSEKPFDRDESDPGQPYSGHVHPKSMGWLNHHPDKYNIAIRFKHRLQDAGHDGIVYGNEFERSNHGSSATSAIAFHPHQIEITQDHTVNKNCLKPGDLSRRPGPGQEMLPGTENLPSKRPYAPPPGDWHHPKTWHDPKMWRESKMTPHGVDWGRLTAPLPPECWDRYHGRQQHTGAKKHTYTVQRYAPQGGYETVEKEIEGPLYHGGRGKLQPGDMITPGRKPNSWGDEGPKSTHVYFSTDRDTAASYSQQFGNKGHLYEVEPTGEFRTDYGPQDYKTPHPLRVVRKVPREEWQLGSKTAAEYGDPTDWDKHYDPSTEIHRGMFTKVPFGLFEKLHGSVPKEDAATALMGHTSKRKSSGMHWSADLDQARDFGSPRTTMGLQVPVVLHGQVPAREAIETRPAMLRRNEVFPHDHREKEVPLRKGSNVDVFGISWKPEKPHPDADESGWVRHDFTTPRQHTATVYPGHETALHEMGQQTVYPVSTPRGVTNLCQHHLNVHQSISAGSNDLAGHLGIPQAPSEPLGAPQTGKCADCNKNTDYMLKLQRPEGFDRQQQRDSQQPRTRQTGPYVPAKTKPLTVLRQSQNTRSVVSGSSNNGIRTSSSEDTTNSVESGGSNRRAPGQRLDHLRASTFVQVEPRFGTAGHHCKVCGTTHRYEEDVESHEGAYTDWDKHYPSVGDIHRGIGVHLPPELHERLHAEDEDLEDNGDSRGEVMHDLVGHLNKQPGGWHWTTDSNKAQEFAHDYGSYGNQEHDTPRTYLNLTGHRPKRSDIETDPEKLTNVDDQEYGGAVERYDSPTGEREVPLKAGTKVHIKDIGFQLHGPRSRDGAGGWRHHNLQDDDDLVGPRHVTAGRASSWAESHYGVKLANEQGELFHVEPTGPQHSPKAEWHQRMIDKHTAPKVDPDDVPESCDDCGETHSANQGHRECHACGERHQDMEEKEGHETTQTDWDQVYPRLNNTVHRVLKTMDLPDHVHDAVHDESRPMADRAHALLAHVNEEHGDAVGMHWSDTHDPSGNGGYGADKFAGTGSSDTRRTQVMLHATKPQRHHIETDLDTLMDHQVYGYDAHDENEVPISRHSPVSITGVSWRPGGYNQKWRRHDLTKPMEMTAMKKLPTLQMVAHDATENQELRHCPFCGGGKIIGRQDGTVECQFCHQFFTVQVQPQFPNFPQTVDGMPQQIPGMPGQVDTPPGATVPGGGFPPGEEGAEDPAEGGNPFADGDADDAGGPPDGDADDGGGEEPPPFAKKSFRTVTGALLDEDSYARHMAIRLTPDRDAMIALIRQEQGAR